jgi:hypothetical protein
VDWIFASPDLYPRLFSVSTQKNMKVYDPGEWEGVVYESGSWCGGKICLFGKNNYLLVCLPFFIRLGFLNTLKMLGVVRTLMELCTMLALERF